MSERLMIGVSLSVVVHLIAFLVLGQLIDLEREPERIGPMLVQLAEVPVPAVVRDEPAEEPSSPRPQPATAPAAVAAAATAVPAPAQPAQPGTRPRVAPGVPTPRPLPEQQPAPRTSPRPEPRVLPPDSAGTEPRPAVSGPLPTQGYDQPVTVPKEQPVRPEAGAAAPGVLDTTRLDAALSGGAAAGGTATSSGAPAPGGTSGASSGVSSGVAQRPYEIEWDNREQGRDTAETPAPIVPAWVSREGLSLTVDVTFVLTDAGLLRDVKVAKSSGYSDVDSAVLEALRRWRFRAAPNSRDISGRVRYSIVPR